MLSIKTLVSLFCPVELCVILIFNNYFYVTRAASRHYITFDLQDHHSFLNTMHRTMQKTTIII